jgi:predicted Zn-dependent protease
MKNTVSHWGFLLIAATVFLTACHTVPETGRTQLMLMPVSQEVTLGSDAFSQIKSRETISTNAEAIAQVKRVGQRIALQAAADMPEAEWEFVVFEGDDTLNAFALPGGKVGIYTGILKAGDTDDRLAAVMGHEIAHVTARHGAARMSRAMALSAVGVGIGVATRDQDAQTRQAIMVAYGLGATLGVELPYSRRAESEADEIGVMYAARAGYDPREAITFWENMRELAGQQPRPPAFLSTHPTDDRRIADLQRLMPRAMEEYEQARASVR